MDINSIFIGSLGSAAAQGLLHEAVRHAGLGRGRFVGWQIGSGALTGGPHDQVKGKSTEPGRVIWNIQTSDVDRRASPIRTTTTFSS
jgi:hypothetical protein